jgi:hypothetical protein
MDVDHIDTYPAGAVFNFQRSGGSIVPATILGPSDRGADYVLGPQPVREKAHGVFVFVFVFADVVKRRGDPEAGVLLFERGIVLWYATIVLKTVI